ncbi:transcriptional regulator, TetR family [Saccharopolyspora kobensis]|uniref:Transcriptional regulator, TetR family n=1 Tax=Saccharopolyspora kobensis TaxID=146035 RepID=A0A1H6EGY2_9PSEU|nr:TetR/AcrR family transcriptional regulator [Saccharopolyspora kobensis]SEG97108.1 transcriptional regulator, TetR family [Saccharopolyspora kobensis]SFE66550.1 transcriptional regulator, TetR family [Saccharopolyspora kobensis]
MTDQQQQRRRQARGERRIELLLDAAAEVFGEVGYAAATTNAIASRAGSSPGSLYQFFPNKEEIARALAERYLRQLQEAHRTAFAAENASLPLTELIDSILDPMIDFNLSNPGFQALFNTPDEVARKPLHISEAVIDRLSAIFAARAPGLPRDQRIRTARLLVGVFRGALPLITSSSGPERSAVLGDLKRIFHDHLEPLIGA